jgi:hypothetical protein
MSLTDKSINSVDVLCGRGNKINYTPGNVRFRKLVDDNRYAYVTAPRHSKVDIATRVIEAVRKSGGRFLGLNPRTKKWEEVPLRRATEKACQALREDATAKIQVLETRQISDTRPQGPSKKKKSSKKPSAPAKKTTHSKPALPSNRSKSSKSQPPSKPHKPSSKASSKPPIKESRSQGTVTSLLKKKSKKKKKKEKKFLTEEQVAQGAALHDGIELAQLTTEVDKNLPCIVSPYAMEEDHFEDDPDAKPFRWYGTKTEEEWGKMFKRLERFRKILGHAAVPPNWAGDLQLANWSCTQRHLYREVVETSHREPTKLEQKFIQKLEEMDFVWDYEEWRWHQCYKDLERRLNTSLVQGGTMAAALPESSTRWLEEQEELATLDKLSEAQVTKLKNLAVNVTRQEDIDEDDFLLI